MCIRIVHIGYNTSLFDHIYHVYIDKILNDLISILISSSQHFASNVKRCKNVFPVGMTNDYLKVEYRISRRKFVTWNNTRRLKRKKSDFHGNLKTFI